jgi:hypothetical protein
MQDLKILKSALLTILCALGTLAIYWAMKTDMVSENAIILATIVAVPLGVFLILSSRQNH